MAGVDSLSYPTIDLATILERDIKPFLPLVSQTESFPHHKPLSQVLKEPWPHLPVLAKALSRKTYPVMPADQESRAFIEARIEACPQSILSYDKYQLMQWYTRDTPFSDRAFNPPISLRGHKLFI